MRQLDLLPTFKGLQMFVLGVMSDDIPYEELEKAGHRLNKDPTRRYMDTVYYTGGHGTPKLGLSALCPGLTCVFSCHWFGTEVFFYVCASNQGRSVDAMDIVGAKLPSESRELPPWVLSVLHENSRGLSRGDVVRNVNQYLSTFPKHGGRALQILRTVNWAILPLLWKPYWFVDKQIHVSIADSAAAQTRTITYLTQHAAAMEGCDALDLDDVKCEMIDILGDLTGICPDDRYYDY